MTKAEFLELRAGEQRWVLLRCLRFVLHMVIPAKAIGLTSEVLEQFDRNAEGAAQEITEDES
ncbi:hypothetical protein KAT82_08475 [bacterium]|nr:hypothetical protein [bacterium]